MFYYCTIKKEKDLFGVNFPDLPNVITFGFNKEHAIEMAKEALDGVLESHVDNNFSIPDSVFKDGIPIEVSAKVTFALELRRARAKQSQSDIAKKIGMTYQQYQRLENPRKTNPTLVTIEKLQKVFNRKFLAI